MRLIRSGFLSLNRRPAAGELEEDLFQASCGRTKFIEIPAGSDHGTRQVSALQLSLLALHFKDQALLFAFGTRHAADSRDTFEFLLHQHGFRLAIAAMILYACLLLFTALNFAFLFRYGNPDWKPLAVGYLGLLLQGGTLLALGTFISTLTKNQIIAGAATFGVCLLLWVLEWSSGYDSSTWAKVLAYLSVITHFDSFARGVIDSKDVIFYLSGIFLGLFLTARSMESLRWRS